MTAVKPGSGIAQSEARNSTSEQVHGSDRANINTTRIVMSDRTLATIALIFGSMALMGVFWAISEARYAERENRLAQLELHAIKNALHAHGIKDLNPHLLGEPE